MHVDACCCVPVQVRAVAAHLVGLFGQLLLVAQALQCAPAAGAKVRAGRGHGVGVRRGDGQLGGLGVGLVHAVHAGHQLLARQRPLAEDHKLAGQAGLRAGRLEAHALHASAHRGRMLTMEARPVGCGGCVPAWRVPA